MPIQPSQQIVSELAPTGVLRAAINMGNFLLVTGKTPSGDPTGVSADIAAAIAARLGVPVKYLPYARPGDRVRRIAVAQHFRPAMAGQQYRLHRCLLSFVI